MDFKSLLIETIGSLVLCILLIFFFRHLYSKIYAKCIGKSPSMADGNASSNVNPTSPQQQRAELSPPPSYDEVLSGEIFVINIDDKHDPPTCYVNEHLPTYDEAVVMSSSSS